MTILLSFLMFLGLMLICSLIIGECCCSSISKVIVIIVFLVLFVFSSLFTKSCMMNSNYSYMSGYESLKETYEKSMKSTNLTGLEKIQIVKEIADINSELAKKKYNSKKWYGFDIPKEIINLEPIEMN